MEEPASILRKKLTYAQTTRVIVIFLAIFMGLLYQRLCHVQNNIAALRKTVEIVQEEVELGAFLLESIHLKTQRGFQDVDQVLENHSGMLLETIDALAVQEEFNGEIVGLLEEVNAGTALSFPKVIAEAQPAVVSIVWYENEPSQPFGAGVLISCYEGLVLTAKHVVRDDQNQINSNEYYVVLNGERVQIKEIFSDPYEDLAILVLDIEDPNYRPIKAFPIALPNNISCGQLVITLGYPFGLALSAGAGIVSNPDGEHINVGLSKRDIQNKVMAPRIQFDAASNPGNSGGPVLNLDGEIIGICVTGQDGCPIGATNAGVNFAVPTSEIVKSLERFRAWQAGDLVIKEEDTFYHLSFR